MLLKKDCPPRVGDDKENKSGLKISLKPACVASEANDNMHSRTKIEFSCTWKSPPKFAIDCDWSVAAAEESQEVEAQNAREARELEAFYPRLSAIPPNPSEAPDSHLGHIDDAQVPEIPLIEIEDEEEDESEMAAPVPSEGTIGLQALDPPTDVRPDITERLVLDADATAAAVGAYRAMVKWKEQGNLIDSDLLVSILKNPESIKKHICEDGFSRDALNEPAAMIKEGVSSTTDVGSKKSCDVSGPSIKKHIGEDGFSKDALNEPASMIKEGGSSTTDVGSKKSCDESGPSTSTESLPVSTLPQVTSTVCLQNLNMDSDSTAAVVATCTEMKGSDSKSEESSSSASGSLKETNEPSIPDQVGFSPFSWTPSVPFKMSQSNETLINNVLDKLKGTCPSPRPQIPISSFQVVPMVVTAGTGPSLRPQFPNSSLHLGPLQNVGPNHPPIAITVGTGPSPRPYTPRPSFFCVPPQNVGPNATFVAMPAPIGTSLRPNISSLHSVPKIVPQGAGAPNVVPTSPPKDVEYMKNLIRKHGNEQETPKTDDVEVGKSQDEQEIPAISIVQQPVSGKPRCKFFSGPGGCRNGVKCRFEHVVEILPNAGGLLQEAPDSKRMKLGGEFGSMK